MVCSGEDTEIDRNMVDVLDELLMHMVRNALDHGIEAQAERRACGKPERGRVALSAWHAGGNIVVEVKDDGKGLSREKILRKAVSQELVKDGEILSDQEVFSLIFLPGFSTADKLTDISGRGVGMDVVKKGVESLRGRIETASVPGQGCAFALKLPLTMAITDGMLVRVSDQRYIIPMATIFKTLRPEAKSLTTVSDRGEMLNLNGEIIPILRLHRIFGISGGEEKITEGLLMILDDGHRHCALLVDELLGQQQVVAKAINMGGEKQPGITGGAILADGRVGLILDTQGIIALARQKS
jgi:two-component system chemotaxis sensor kinase CheA